MKVNSILLFHEIERYFQVEYMQNNNNNEVSTVILYNSFFDISRHIVLVNTEDLKECLRRANHSVVVCLEAPASLPPCGTNDLAVINDPMSNIIALNILTHILDQFNNWDQELNQILFNRQGFQQMIDSIYHIIRLPVGLVDSNRVCIAASKNFPLNIPENRKNRSGLTRPDTDFPQISRQSSDFLPTDITENPDQPYVLRNLLHKGDSIGYLVIWNSELSAEPDSIDFYKTVLDIAAPFVEKLYIQFEGFTNKIEEHKHVHNFMVDIFNRRPADRKAFRQLMLRLGSCDHDEWTVLLISSPSKDSTFFNTIFNRSQIEHDFPGCYCISKNHQILILANLTLYKRKKDEKADFPADFTLFLSNAGLIGYISRNFLDITILENIFTAYRQTLFVQEYPYESTDSLLFFDDFALDYLLLHGVGDLSKEQICHPALLKLHAYDCMHGTHYIQTLHSYLIHNMNAVATAKALFIHRSSFINRMERIHQLASMDLKNPRENLYLMMSYALFGDDL